MTSNSDIPRQPWTPWGFMWRAAVYLAGLLLLCFLAALLRGCDATGRDSDNGRDSGENPYPWTDDDPYSDRRDTIPIEGWTDSIPGVRELPVPERNYIPPYDSTRIGPNPDDSISRVVMGEAIILFNSTDLKADMASFARRYKELYPDATHEVRYYNPTTGMMLIGFPDSELQAMLDNLPRQITGIDFKIVSNEVMAESYVPSDPGFKVAAYDEYYKLIQAYDAWDITKGSPDIKVAIVDSYFDLDHPLLKGRYVNPINIVTKTADVYPPASCPADGRDVQAYCHGTHVAALAVGAMDNGVGCSGIAPECTWIPISIGDNMSAISLIEGILYAIYQGADVVNFSIGAILDPSVKDLSLEDQVYLSQNRNLRGQDLWEYVVKVANDHNCTLVTAAGNDSVLMGLDSKNRSDGMVKVEAVDGKGKVTDFSNFGTIPALQVAYSTVAAPGLDIWSATDGRCTPIWESAGVKVDRQQALQEMPGTSMAAPIVAGAVALMKSKRKDITTGEIIKILEATGKQTDPGKPIGPTIQIRDALDAVGGEYANFDEIMRDHNLLVGKWRSTQMNQLTENPSGKKLDDLWTYFIFDTPTSGFLEHHALKLKKIFRAPISVKWNTDSFEIIQHGEAVAQDGDRMTVDHFICNPDENHLLNASSARKDGPPFSFMLRKVN